nr:sugar transferase [Aurantiacibacter rhizosphaerae]
MSRGDPNVIHAGDAAEVTFDTADLQATRRHPIAPTDGLVGSLERKRLQIYLFLILADTAVLFGTFLAATAIYYGSAIDINLIQDGLLPAFLLLPVYLTVALYNGTYSQSCLTDTNRSVVRMIAAMLIAAALVNFLAFFAKMNAEFSRVIFTAGMVGATTAMALVRFGTSAWITRLWGPKPVNQLVIHAGGPRFTLPFAYHIDAETHGLSPDMNDPTQLDRFAKYLCNMDEVIISCEDSARLMWAEMLKGSGRHGEIISEFTRAIGALGVVHHDDANVSGLLVSTGRLGMRSRVLKRLFDIALSSVALLALSPVMAAVAIAIKLQDGGPIFFHQRRVGRGNRFFNIYKFRSMSESDARGDRSASKDDDRITPIGRFIRRTSIDELPQLINVVKGDMSHQPWITRCAIRRSYAQGPSSSSCWPPTVGPRNDRPRHHCGPGPADGDRRLLCTA